MLEIESTPSPNGVFNCVIQGVIRVIILAPKAAISFFFWRRRPYIIYVYSYGEGGRAIELFFHINKALGGFFLSIIVVSTA